MNLPDRSRPRLALPPVRSRGWAGAALWRLLHPRAREPYAESPVPPPARRLYYGTEDGWSAPLFRLEPRPDAPGEPVVVVHGSGFGPDALRYGADALAGQLLDAGFAPFLATVRTSRHASPGPDPAVRVEDVALQDLPAALLAVAAETGFPRVHLVAHGLAGVLALAFAARRPPALASVVVLGAPLSFAPASAARWSHRLAQLLPADADVPVRALLRAGAWLDPELFGWSTHTPGPRVRGVARCASEDVGAPWVRAMARWWRDGAASLHDGLVDVVDLLPDAAVPLLVVTASGDAVCPPEAGELALGRWGHADATAERVDGGHLDLVTAGVAGGHVARWLSARRRAGWVVAA